jgi:hypothetical protein
MLCEEDIYYGLVYYFLIISIYSLIHGISVGRDEQANILSVEISTSLFSLKVPSVLKYI